MGRALEDLIGTELTDVPKVNHQAPAVNDLVEAKPATVEPTSKTSRPRRTRPTRQRIPNADDEQLDLFAVRAPTP